MPNKLGYILKFFFLVLALAFLGFFLKLGINGYISDSEIWSVTLAKHWEEWRHSWVFTRPLFYGVLSLAEWPFSDAISIFMAAKIVGIVNGLLIVWLTFRLARTISDSGSPVQKIVPWVAIVFLLSNSGFLNQGYRIRSDLFACTLLLFVLERSLQPGRKYTIKNNLWWFLPVLATPKALISILPFAAFPMSKKAKTAVGAVAFLGIFVLMLVYPQGLTYFGETVIPSKEKIGLLAPERFLYLQRLFEKNYLFFSLLFVRTITLFTRRSSEERRSQKNFNVFVAISAVIVLLYPDKPPFFLASFLPIFSVFAALLCEDIWLALEREIPQNRKKFYRYLYVSSLIFLGLALGVNGKRHIEIFSVANNSKAEFNSIKIIEKYLNDYPAATYYDVVGIIPQRATHRFFVGPHDPVTNSYTMYELKANPPHLLFYVQKLSFLEPDIKDLIESQYYPLGSNIYARWFFLEKPMKLANKAGTRLQEELQKVANVVGLSSLPSFSALVVAKKNAKPIRIQGTEAELMGWIQKNKGAELLALSPFLDFIDKPRGMNSLIRFEWNL